jgi:hypothetical protein
MPEALLSSRLCYKFRDRDVVTPSSLFELANLAYTNYDTEQAIINACSGKDPLERLERLTLLKSAIWRRGTAALAPGVAPPPPPKLDIIGGKSVTSGAYKAGRVYALMGFFEHRIHPNRSDDDLRALVRLSMANDNDRIVSMLPSTITQTACWYSDDDVYQTNLWDIVPEIQVAGVTENGALVVDGCRLRIPRSQKTVSIRVGTLPNRHTHSCKERKGTEFYCEDRRFLVNSDCSRSREAYYVSDAKLSLL